MSDLLQDELIDIGITDSNRYHNLFEYSSIACQSLDFAASAAGKLDAEAARFLRMAHGMMRFRADKLLELSLFGAMDGNKKFMVSNKKLPLCAAFVFSGAAIAAMQGENADPLLDGIDLALSNQGDPMKLEGHLIIALAMLARSERFIIKVEPEVLAITVSDEEKDTVLALQLAAHTILDLVMQSLQILKDKVLERQGLYVCLNCGYQSAVAPDEEWECPLCGSKRGSVCHTPVRPGKESAARYARLIA